MNKEANALDAVVEEKTNQLEHARAEALRLNETVQEAETKMSAAEETVKGLKADKVALI